ncbi:molybdopterin-guanine dinucleotide biosynthesis protein B [Chloroflexota bacterium]
MRLIISIVGRSESGKTTMLESLIAELKRRGYKVAIIKHSGEDVELDTVNKDTWRFSLVGSEISAISSGHKLAIFKQTTHDFSPKEFSNFTSLDYDLLLTEGFKRSSYPKIEVHRKEQGRDLVSPPQQLLAVVTDEPLEVDVPQFSKDEVQKIADLVENIILDRKMEDDIDLIINGTHISMNPPLKNLLTRTLVAMLSGLNGAKEVKTLHLSLRRKT